MCEGAGSPCLLPRAALLPFRSCIKKKPGLARAGASVHVVSTWVTVMAGLHGSKKFLVVPEEELYGFLLRLEGEDRGSAFFGERPG